MFFSLILSLDVDKFLERGTKKLAKFEEYLNRNTAFV